MDFKFTVTQPVTADKRSVILSFDGYGDHDAMPVIKEMLNAMADGLERHGFHSEAVIYHTTKERI